MVHECSSRLSIGANATIDCGVATDTFVGDGVKIDNLVQISHDVIIGSHSGIAENVMIIGASTVTRSLRQTAVYSSDTTVQKHQVWRKNAARFHQLDKMIRKIRAIERSIELEE